MATEKIELLADRVAAGLDHDGSARQTPQLYRSLLRLLVHGEPVTIAQLAQAAGEPEAAVRRAAATWTDTEYDDDGRISATA